jgi:uncharacterized protein (DUF362 family)
MTRRELIRALGASALWAWPSPSLPGAARESAGDLVPGARLRVGLFRCPDYDRATLIEAVRTGWRATRPPDVRGKSVVIKPNIADYAPDRPIHTDPRLVEALVLHLRDLGAGAVTLAEGPPHNRDTELLFRLSGYEALAGRLEVPLVDLNYDSLRRVPNANPKATLLRELFLPETVLAADVVISVPKMKTHRYAGVTLSLKNMFGVVPGIRYGWPKNILHWNGIPLSICEINATIKAHYAIVDGIVGMEGYGPLLGTAVAAGVLVMGDNALAVDATAARVMGVDPALVEYMVMSQRIKIGSLRPGDIDVLGESVEKARRNFALDRDFAFLRAPGKP